MVTLTSGCSSSSSTKTSQPLPFDATNHLQDTSFSSYINRSEHLSLGRKKVGDGEIGVFRAEKYFNGGIDEKDPRLPSNGAFKYPSANNEPIDAGPPKQVEIGPVKPTLQPRTPSVHSVSSWNSQGALLQKNVPINPPQRRTIKRHAISLFASLGCNCACSGRNSVDIDDHAGGSNDSKACISFGGVEEKRDTKESIQNAPVEVNLVRNDQSRLTPLIEMNCKKNDEVGLNREDCFSFPILSSKSGDMAVKVGSKEEEDEKERKSLEVFAFPVLDNQKSLSFERRLTTLAGEEIEIRASSDGMCCETESDASSDLFEIESFTRNGNLFYLREPSNGTSSCVTSTTCFAPSEASTEWSVITASAADLLVASDSEDTKDSTKACKISPNARAAAARKERERRCSGILSGCKSHKSVRIAGEAHRINLT